MENASTVFNVKSVYNKLSNENLSITSRIYNPFDLQKNNEFSTVDLLISLWVLRIGFLARNYRNIFWRGSNILLANKNASLRKLDFFQIKISPIFCTLKKIKIIPWDLLSVDESHGIFFSFSWASKKLVKFCFEKSLIF